MEGVVETPDNFVSEDECGLVGTDALLCTSSEDHLHEAACPLLGVANSSDAVHRSEDGSEVPVGRCDTLGEDDFREARGLRAESCADGFDGPSCPGALEIIVSLVGDTFTLCTTPGVASGRP